MEYKTYPCEVNFRYLVLKGVPVVAGFFSEKDAAELSDQLRQKGIEIVTADGEDQRAARGIGGAVGKQVGKEKVKGCGR